MRSWLYQRMYSSTKASTSLRVCSSHFSGWTASVFILPKNPSAAALSGEQPFALVFSQVGVSCFVTIFGLSLFGVGGSVRW